MGIFLLWHYLRHLFCVYGMIKHVYCTIISYGHVPYVPYNAYNGVMVDNQAYVSATFLAQNDS
jgi:hypothetical protein